MTNTPTTESTNFMDARWSNSPTRFYRLVCGRPAGTNTPARNSAALTNDVGVTAVASIGRADSRKTHQNHKTGDSRAPQM
ncbi:MAG: hypothetical protein ABR924_13910 [Terracidiphilus sp.]